ncbi:polyprenyl synthetase family protein [Holdemania massiliensis]|uniref:polyprenyl synthetase family protein n=1 Tax=Holdemania massiliensis TaxID=1468449 RepID=UPI001F0591FD|nr:farnesyl diphosphate synthase [Holdemania massiliensis]MCH1940919.1 polyprenyl synthetase family protein [Holdemania massiliensis]
MMNEFEEFLQRQCRLLKHSEVSEAMEYSLMGKGKRLRPQLLFAVMEGYGLAAKDGFMAAGALEMMHTYSLIHDDLPAMDNDDYRRGRKTCHKQFNEATAILAGDGLLTQAFALAAESSADPMKALKIVKELASAGGAEGMILGQIKDLEAENSAAVTLEQLKEVHLYKTGCLFTAPLVMGAILAGQDAAISQWRRIGALMGLAFQIQDDILDVTKSSKELGKSASDLDNKKSTYVTILGLGQAQDAMTEVYRQTRDAIRQMDMNTQQLIAILDAMEFRQY